MMELRFQVLKVGQCRQLERLACRTAPWRIGVFPALAAVIWHPTHGACLFDTGYAARFFTVTNGWPERAYQLATPVELPPAEFLVAQLAGLDLAPSDIGTLIVSHFHADHIAGVRDFPRARFVCSQEGLTSIRTIGRIAGVRRGLIPALLPDDLEARARFFEACPAVALPPALAPFDFGSDVFGDGSVLAVSLPGHAPGQYGLVFRADGGRLVFLVADAAWSSNAIRDDALPAALAGVLVGHSADYADTFHRLHALSAANPDVLIVPSHCRGIAREFAQWPR